MLHVSQTIGDDHFRVRQVLFHISFCYYYHTASSLSNPCSFPVRPQLGRRSQGSSVVHEECNNHENGEITPSPPERRRKINTSFRQGILCEQQIQASRAFAADRGIQNKPTKKIIDEGIRCLCGAIFKGHYWGVKALFPSEASLGTTSGRLWRRPRRSFTRRLCWEAAEDIWSTAQTRVFGAQKDGSTSPRRPLSLSYFKVGGRKQWHGKLREKGSPFRQWPCAEGIPGVERTTLAPWLDDDRGNRAYVCGPSLRAASVREKRNINFTYIICVKIRRLIVKYNCPRVHSTLRSWFALCPEGC